MPRILEMKLIENEVWVKVQLDRNTDVLGSFYVWTAEEAKQHAASAIRTFCFELANSYIEKRWEPNAET